LHLPDVLADQMPVTVLHTDGVSLTVRDVQGREWVIQKWLVDCGFEFLQDGQWLHESDPVVLTEIERMLGTEDPETPCPYLSPAGIEFRDWLRSILRRHGHGEESRS
jgi:hypothetical protein